MQVDGGLRAAPPLRRSLCDHTRGRAGNPWLPDGPVDGPPAERPRSQEPARRQLELVAAGPAIGDDIVGGSVDIWERRTTFHEGAEETFHEGAEERGGPEEGPQRARSEEPACRQRELAVVGDDAVGGSLNIWERRTTFHEEEGGGGGHEDEGGGGMGDEMRPRMLLDAGEAGQCSEADVWSRQSTFGDDGVDEGGAFWTSCVFLRALAYGEDHEDDLARLFRASDARILRDVAVGRPPWGSCAGGGSVRPAGRCILREFESHLEHSGRATPEYFYCAALPLGPPAPQVAGGRGCV